ncbi:hypothetical protein GOODEAATRI_017185, partial [Goodea atripinnis]
DSAEYPLVQSGPSARWFHSEFCDFVSVLVAQCQHGVLFDSYLMNSLISLLTELSNSFVRAFRHTCTLAGFTPAEQAVIVEILIASVRQAAEGPALVGRSGAKKVSVVVTLLLPLCGFLSTSTQTVRWLKTRRSAS